MPGDRDEVLSPADARGSGLIVPIEHDKIVRTRRPDAGGVLGELLPVAFPVTVSKFFFGTTAVRITDSNGRIPPTADIEPVVSSLAPGPQTVPLTPSAGGLPPVVEPTDPPEVCETSFRTNGDLVSSSSYGYSFSNSFVLPSLFTVTGMWLEGVMGGRDDGEPSIVLDVFSPLLSDGASLTRVDETGSREVRENVSHFDILQMVTVKTGETMRPAVVEMLGMLLPAALPVTVSTLPFETRSVLAIDSNTRMPGTAVMDPVAVSNV